jgi:hypothetical protein
MEMAEANPTKAVARKRRQQHVVMAACGLVLLAGIVAALLAFGPNRDAAPEKFSNEPVQFRAMGVKAPLSADAQRVARRFVQTAVARKHLAEAYDLVGPNLRGNLTLEQWLTGNIPVIPYPLETLQFAPFKIDYSNTTDALLEVALLPKDGSGVKGQIFFLGLKKVGAGGKERWVVDSWVPRGSARVPTGDNN